MSRWARLDRGENGIVVGEIITYDPQTIINEQLWDRFVPCEDNVLLGFYYNSDTNQFYIPEGYGRFNLNDDFITEVLPGYIVGEDYLFVQDPNYIIPKEITESEFRSKLNFTEKLLWDNPETGTDQQKATINTIKLDFPFTSIEDFQDELDFLENVQVIGIGRAAEIASEL